MSADKPETWIGNIEAAAKDASEKPPYCLRCGKPEPDGTSCLRGQK